MITSFALSYIEFNLNLSPVLIQGTLTDREGNNYEYAYLLIILLPQSPFKVNVISPQDLAMFKYYQPVFIVSSAVFVCNWRND